MHVDTAFRKAFIPLIALLIGAAAYFQAIGLRELALAVMARRADPIVPPWRRPPRSALAELSIDHATDASPLLAHNPFDSRTPRLDGTPPPGPARGDEDAPCPSARVVLIAASGDDWSFAAIAEGGRPPVLRRAGDQLAGYSIAAIGRDRVWLAAGRSRCHVSLGAAPPPPEDPPVKRSGGDAPERGPRRARGALPPEIAAGIRRVGDHEVEVDRYTLDAILERKGELLGSIRALPEKEGDRVTGVRITGVRPGSLLEAIGIRNGDRITSINGLGVDPTTMLQAYTRLRGADHLVVAVTRGGAPMSLDVRIR
ncbi:MAG: PDZ domain-containing protein [Polyangiaceae bacterium]|nr:PDZ domain-containing protein [Polyangiaceae bacterium]